MKVREIVAHCPISVSPNLTVCEVAHLMDETGCSFLPVVERNVPIGVVTDRDLTIRVAGAGLDPTRVYVSRVMTTPPICVDAEAEAEEAAHWMLSNFVRRLIVVHCGQLVGILSVTDLPGYIADEAMVSVLHSFAEHSHPKVIHHFTAPMPEVYVG